MLAPILLLILANDAALCIQDLDKVKPEEAIRRCTAAIQSGGLADAVLSKALASRCRAYGTTKDYAHALPDCDRAISLDPNSASAWSGRGLVYAKRAHSESQAGTQAELYDQAIRDLTESLRLKPDGHACLERGWCYFQRQDRRAAKEDIDEAIRLGQGAKAYYYRGWWYLYEKDYDRAIEDLCQSIRLDPSSAGSYTTRAWLYSRRGEYSRAIQDYDHALRLHPDAATYRLRGYLHYREGEYGAALLDVTRGTWRVAVPVAILVCMIYILGRRRKPEPNPTPADEEPEPIVDSPEPDLPPEDRPEPDASDLDVLISSGLRDLSAIALAEAALGDAGIPFSVMDQNVQTRQEGGNIAGWWNVRVPRDREAEAREIIHAVEEMK